MSIKLSPSRVKTLKECSWIYWCKYILGLPEKTNDGAKRGTICHNVFEKLQNYKTRTQYNKIKEKNDVFASPLIKKMILSQASEMGVDDDENLSLIKDMIINGISHDFYGESLGTPTKSYTELEFNIEKNDYKIRGFIDQLFLYEDKKLAVIRDYKSSKKVFSDFEKEDNLQDYFYSLAIRHLFPDYKSRFSEFWFLRFDLKQKGLVKMETIDEDVLDGFEFELAQIQDHLENFSEKDAKSNFAYDQGFPTEDYFGGKLKCGFATEKNELKKDGTIKYACPFRFDFYYVEVYDSSDNFVASYFKDDFDKSMIPEKGRSIMKHYAGCPRHFPENY